MTKLRRALPGATQLVYDYPSSVVVSFSMSERGYEGLVAVAVAKHGVQLYFDKSLPDPKGLLKGSGTKVRSVALDAATDIDGPDIQALIKAAITHAGAKPAGTGATRMIFKSKSKLTAKTPAAKRRPAKSKAR